MESDLVFRSKSSSTNKNFAIEKRVSQTRAGFRTCTLSAQQENIQLKSRIKQLEQLLLTKDSLATAGSRGNVTLPVPKVLKPEQFMTKISEKQLFTTRLKETVHVLQKEVKRLRKENFDLKEEVTKLIKNNKNSEIIAKIFRACLCNMIDVEELWYIVNPNGFELVSSVEFQRGIRGIGLDLKEKEVNKLFLMLCQGEEVISKRQFVFQLQAMKPTISVTFEEVKGPVERLKKVMEELGTAKEFVETNFNRKNLSFKFVMEEFREKLAGAVESDVEVVVRGIFGCFLSLECGEFKRVLNKLMNM